MRGKLGLLLGVLVFVTGVLSWSAPAMADSITTLGSFSDPRTAMKQRPGHTIKRIRYGLNPSSNFVISPANQVYNSIRIDNVPPPCTNCHITDIVPSLVYNGDANHADGTTANLDTDAMLHHFVLINGGRTDAVCQQGEGALGERFFAAGNERSQMHLPEPFGYYNTQANWRLISHIINKSATVTKSFQIEVVYQYRTTGGVETKPLWFDIDGCGDSEYTTPVGYNDATVNWTSTVSGRMLGMSGHLHDVDITNRRRASITVPRRGTASRSRPSSSAATPTTTTGRSRRTTHRRHRSLARPSAAPSPNTGRRGRQRLPRPSRLDDRMRGHRPTCRPHTRPSHGPRAASIRPRAIRSVRGRRSGSTASTRTTPASPRRT